MKALVGAFKQEPSMGPFPDYKPSDGPSFEALLSTTTTRNSHHLHSGASARVFPGSAWAGRDECWSQ